MEERCYKCHSSKKVKGELRLDSLAWIRKGGENGEVVIPGDPDGSALFFLTDFPEDDPDYMPQKGKGLSDGEKALLRLWIEQGAGGVVEMDIAGDLSTKVRSGSNDNLSGVSKYEDGGGKGSYGMSREVASLAAKLKEAGVLVDTVNHDASLLELSYRHSGLPSNWLVEIDSVVGSVVKLNLSRTRVVDADLEVLRRFSNLEYLDLKETSVSSAGMANLLELQNLRYLNLCGTNVDDESINLILEMPRLERLYLWGSKISGRGIRTLQRERPNLSFGH